VQYRFLLMHRFLAGPTRPPRPVGFSARLLLALLGALLLCAGMVVHSPASAVADETWCWGDPVVQIGTSTISIIVGARGDPASLSANITAADIVIVVPRGVSTRVLSITNPYFPEQVTFVTSGATWRGGPQPIPVSVVVRFHATAVHQTALQITHDGVELAAATGTTATGLRAHIRLR
jgi:hypothetical protein